MRTKLILATGLAFIGFFGCNDDDSGTGRLERVTDRLEDVADRLEDGGGRFLLDASTLKTFFLIPRICQLVKLMVRRTALTSRLLTAMIRIKLLLN